MKKVDNITYTLVRGGQVGFDIYEDAGQYWVKEQELARVVQPDDPDTALRNFATWRRNWRRKKTARTHGPFDSKVGGERYLRLGVIVDPFAQAVAAGDVPESFGMFAMHATCFLTGQLAPPEPVIPHYLRGPGHP